MEEWELDFEWLKVRHQVKDLLGSNQLPDLRAILFLIGIQELGEVKDEFTKEEKQDLMHIATCKLLSQDGYYTFEGLDADGWPHWKKSRKIRVPGVKEQEKLLKAKAIQYFQALEEDNNSTTQIDQNS